MLVNFSAIHIYIYIFLLLFIVMRKRINNLILRKAAIYDPMMSGFEVVSRA